MKIRSMLAALAAATVLSATAALAQWKPDKPITIIVPYPAGGVTDLAVRAVAADLEPALGTKLVVVNQPGANGSVGTQAVMDAPKDGYTWLSGGLRDLGTYKVAGLVDTTIGDWNLFIIASMSSVLSVNPNSGIDSVQAFVEAVKTQGDKLLVATAGPTSSGGQALAAVGTAAGISPKQIVYDGGNPAIIATVSGEAQATTQLVLEQSEMIRAGKLKPLAAIGTTDIVLGDITIPSITKDLPNLPSAENFVGIYLPEGVPQDVIDTLQAVWTETLDKSKGLNELCTTRGCGVKPIAGEEAMATATPAVASAAWGLFDRGEAKVSPDTLGIARP